MQNKTCETKAPKEKDLHDRIAEAVKLMGKDTEWTECTDRGFYIWHNDERLMLAARIPSDEGGLNDNAETVHETTENNNSLP